MVSLMHELSALELHVLQEYYQDRVSSIRMYLDEKVNDEVTEHNHYRYPVNRYLPVNVQSNDCHQTRKCAISRDSIGFTD